MKSFITPEISDDGRKVLYFQYEGIDEATFWNAIDGQYVIAYVLPIGHSFQAAWIFHLIFQNGKSIEFSSACTQVVGWEEVGSLNIRFFSHLPEDLFEYKFKIDKVYFPVVKIQKIQKFVYEDADVISECGLVFIGTQGEEIVVAVGIPPGAVFVMKSFTDQRFEPEFELAVCQREDF
jgi:hypothetical protein